MRLTISNVLYTISFFLSFVNFLIFYSYPFRLENFSISEGLVGVIVGIATILTLFMRIVTGYFMDRFSIKWGIFLASLIYIVALYLVNGNSGIEIITGRLILGIMLGVLSTLLMYYSIITSTDSQLKAQRVAMITFFNALPTCLAPFIALQITNFYGSNSVTNIAFYMFTFCVILSFFLDRTIIKNNTTAIKSNFPKKNNGTFKEGLKGVKKNKNVVAAISILAFTYIISGTTVTFLPSYLMQLGNDYIAWYFLTFSVFMVLPRLLLNKHMPNDDKFPLRLLLFCILLSFIGNLINYLFAKMPFVLIAAICNGTTLGIIYPAIMSYVVCSVGKHISGTLSSIVAAAADIGVIASNLLLGIVTTYISISAAMLIPVFASLISFSIIFSISTVRK